MSVHVSGDDGEGFNLEFGRIQREQDGHRVIDARIRIYDYSLKRLGGYAAQHKNMNKSIPSDTTRYRFTKESSPGKS